MKIDIHHALAHRNRVWRANGNPAGMLGGQPQARRIKEPTL